MNGNGTLNRALLKALFAQLVRENGGQEACAARLGVSRQRVGQLASANPEYARECPTWDHVWTLEEALGRSVVFAGLASEIEPPALPKDACAMKETIELAQAGTALLPLAAAYQADKSPANAKAYAEAAIKVLAEAQDCIAIAANDRAKEA